ncbi:hypothetical protein Tco_0797179 [Tanacetum coccineum]
MKGGRCFGGYKEVTKGLLEALVLKGGDGGAYKLLGRLLGDVIEVLERIKSRDNGQGNQGSGCCRAAEVLGSSVLCLVRLWYSTSDFEYLV